MNYDNYPKLPPPYFDLSDAYTVCQLREAQKEIAYECLRIALFYKTGAEISKRIEERFGPFDE